MDPEHTARALQAWYCGFYFRPYHDYHLLPETQRWLGRHADALNMISRQDPELPAAEFHAGSV